MAVPITSINKKKLTPEELQEQKLAELQTIISEQEEALNKLLKITGELNDMGVLDAAIAAAKAKEEIAKIALHQVSREPITNLLNHALHAATVFSSIDPEMTGKLVESVKSGLDEATAKNEDTEKVNVLTMMKALNDPDINRAVKFGLNFLKGMGQQLKND